MKYKKADLLQVIANALGCCGFEDGDLSIEQLFDVTRTNAFGYDCPCNSFFISIVDFNCITTPAQFFAFIAVCRYLAKDNEAPSFTFSITQKEKGWKLVNRIIQENPRRFQTITTPSRHGKYKVMWVTGRTDGRVF